MVKQDSGNGVNVNGKEIVKNAIDGALGAGKANAGSMSALKIKMKFDNGKSNTKPKKKSSGMRSFINSQRAGINGK
jgi:hypothetical protein